MNAIPRTRPISAITRSSKAFAEKPFSEAADVWFRHRCAYIKDSTRRVYLQSIETLKGFLKDTPLNQITDDTIREFQIWRSERAGAYRVNNEVGILQQILRQARLWKDQEDLYRPLPLPKNKSRQNMNPEEERGLYRACLAKKKRLNAGHCLIVMANTTMGFGELRHLRRQDVELNGNMPFVSVNVQGAKNEYRERTIPLNALALRSMGWIIRRWEKIGGSSPDQFILPHRAKTRGGGWQFDVPMGHIYRAARGILNDAGLSHLDPYDMRSHAITKILSDPNVSPQVSQEIAGHVSKQMQNRYSKQRLVHKKLALDAMCGDYQFQERTAIPEPAPATPAIRDPITISEVHALIMRAFGAAAAAEIDKLISLARERASL